MIVSMPIDYHNLSTDQEIVVTLIEDALNANKPTSLNAIVNYFRNALCDNRAVTTFTRMIQKTMRANGFVARDYVIQRNEMTSLPHAIWCFQDNTTKEVTTDLIAPQMGVNQIEMDFLPADDDDEMASVSDTLDWDCIAQPKRKQLHISYRDKVRFIEMIESHLWTEDEVTAVTGVQVRSVRNWLKQKDFLKEKVRIASSAGKEKSRKLSNRKAFVRSKSSREPIFIDKNPLPVDFEIGHSYNVDKWQNYQGLSLHASEIYLPTNSHIQDETFPSSERYHEWTEQLPLNGVPVRKGWSWYYENPQIFPLDCLHLLVDAAAKVSNDCQG
jgi:hypothetical protein